MEINRKENMDLGLLKNEILDFTKEIGNKFIKEITNYMENQKMTNDSKIEFQNKRLELLKSYKELYEVRDRGVYKYTSKLEYPEFNRDLYDNQKNGFYLLEKDGSLVYDTNLNNEINKKLNDLKTEIIKKQNESLNSIRKKGEEYVVDELGDDDKNIYLTRKKDNFEFEDFKISDALYEKIKKRNEKGEETILIWDGNEYIIK